jgi:hypothetical protein
MIAGQTLDWTASAIMGIGPVEQRGSTMIRGERRRPP